MEKISFFIFDDEYLVYECDKCGITANQQGEYFYD